MRIYAMAYDYGDGSSGVVFYKRKPEEEDLADHEFDSIISSLEDGTWLTFPDDFDLEDAGIRTRD